MSRIQEQASAPQNSTLRPDRRRQEEEALFRPGTGSTHDGPALSQDTFQASVFDEPIEEPTMVTASDVEVISPETGTVRERLLGLLGEVFRFAPNEPVVPVEAADVEPAPEIPPASVTPGVGGGQAGVSDGESPPTNPHGINFDDNQSIDQRLNAVLAENPNGALIAGKIRQLELVDPESPEAQQIQQEIGQLMGDDEKAGEVVSLASIRGINSRVDQLEEIRETVDPDSVAGQQIEAEIQSLEHQKAAYVEYLGLHYLFEDDSDENRADELAAEAEAMAAEAEALELADIRDRISGLVDDLPTDMQQRIFPMINRFVLHNRTGSLFSQLASLAPEEFGSEGQQPQQEGGGQGMYQETVSQIARLEQQLSSLQ